MSYLYFNPFFKATVAKRSILIGSFVISPKNFNLYKFHYLLLVIKTKIFYFSLMRHDSKLNSSLYHALVILLIDIKFFFRLGIWYTFSTCLFEPSSSSTTNIALTKILWLLSFPKNIFLLVTLLNMRWTNFFLVSYVELHQNENTTHVVKCVLGWNNCYG